MMLRKSRLIVMMIPVQSEGILYDAIQFTNRYYNMILTLPTLKGEDS